MPGDVCEKFILKAIGLFCCVSREYANAPMIRAGIFGAEWSYSNPGRVFSFYPRCFHFSRDHAFQSVVVTVTYHKWHRAFALCWVLYLRSRVGAFYPEWQYYYCCTPDLTLASSAKKKWNLRIQVHERKNIRH